MTINTFYILADCNQFSLTEKISPVPVISLEKHQSFHLPDIKPFNEEVTCDLINCGCRLNSFIWISHEKKALYFENPKAGSSSIKASLNMNDPDLLTCLVRILSEWFHVKKYLIRINDYHAVLSENDVVDAVRSINDIVKFKTELIDKQPLITNYSNTKGFELYFGKREQLGKLFNDYFAFSFSRNPYNKFISNYLMFVQKKFRITQLELLDRKSHEHLSIDDFVDLTQRINNHHWNKQSLFVPEFITGFKSYFVGKLENFNEDWKLVSEKLGTEYVYKHINTTEQNDSIAIDQRHITGMIRSVYREDYLRFNYE